MAQLSLKNEAHERRQPLATWPLGGSGGQLTSEELEHEDSERPVVGADVVALVQDDLGGDVLRGAAEGPGLAPDLIPERMGS